MAKRKRKSDKAATIGFIAKLISLITAIINLITVISSRGR